MQEYIIGLNRFDFAALLTVLDELDDEASLKDVVVPWEAPPELTLWDKIKDKLIGSKFIRGENNEKY